jgi:hypothetical protein
VSGRVDAWASRHSWAARAAAWDDAQARAEDAARLDALRAMYRNHQSIARGLIAVGARALSDLDATRSAPPTLHGSSTSALGSNV